MSPGPKVGLRVSMKGADAYLPCLRRAFPAPTAWYGPYGSFDPRFDYVLYVQNLDQQPLLRFLNFLKGTLLVQSALDEVWALDMHMVNESERTEIGEAVYRAKTYGPSHLGDPAVAEELANLMGSRAAEHPGLCRADVVLGVPANPVKQPHNLPELLALGVSRSAGLPLEQRLLVKVRPTEEIKDLPNEGKLDALAGAFEVTRPLRGEHVVLVDDLYFSGSTMGYLAGLLREAGASSVVGVVATKTLRS